MPASRKRNKGKDRKAKQLAKKEEKDRADANRFWRRFCSSSIECNHGRTLVVSTDHPITSFIDQFFVNFTISKTQQNLKDLFETHTQIWTKDSFRTLSIGILAHIGTNMLLLDVPEMSWSDDTVGWSMCLAQCIVVLEHYNGTKDIDSVINSRLVRSKWRDLNPYINSDRRDALKFFRKRTSCKCLKKMHLEARKTLPKLGSCWNCDKEAERVSLSVCSKCMVMQYCSRECQVANYKEHKEYCDEYARIHKQNKQQDIGTSRPTK